MGKKLQAVSSQLSAKKLIIMNACIIAMFLFGAAFDTGANGAEQGKAVTPGASKNNSSGAGVDDDVSKTVADLQKRFSEIKDLKGSFIQKSYIKDLEDTQEYAGTFFIRKPSSMMWEYAAPRDEKVLINGQETWIYKKSENQVIKTRFTRKEYSQVPIALLAGLENISDEFDITVPEKNALQLIPKKKTGFIRYLVLETGNGSMPVKMFTIFDTYGNIIMIELKDVQTNPGLEDSLFTFTVPPGAEVYDMSD
ncbi:MAG: outer membrane lipoprotein chaperone LolA [Nitrospiraceae bacterium]|nr:MAG: outer membrane lipoprotein chaperone LolA [Nitrospiraceae bacterium]